MQGWPSQVQVWPEPTGVTLLDVGPGGTAGQAFPFLRAHPPAGLQLALDGPSATLRPREQAVAYLVHQLAGYRTWDLRWVVNFTQERHELLAIGAPPARAR